MFEVQFREIQFHISDFFGPYNKQYFERLIRHQVEPDTVGFLENWVSHDATFIDIGASIGQFSLMAASLGAQVIAVEPMNEEFECLQKNVSSNPDSIRKVKCLRVAITSEQILTDSRSAMFTSSVITPIVRGNTQISSELKMMSFEQLCEDYFRDKSKNNVVKIDIEGAEWGILRSDSCLKSMAKHKLLILLAIHPGGYRPFEFRKIKFINQLRHFGFRIKNWNESKLVFRKLQSEGASIRKLDYEEITHPRVFSRLVDAGSYEFILDFRTESDF